MTMQIREALIVDGKRLEMESTPALPDCERIDAAEHLPPMLEDLSDDWFQFSTACMRGYRGIWEIRESCLWFIGLSGRFVLAQPMLAEWFSGRLEWNGGKYIGSTGYHRRTVHDREVRVRVESGRVVDTTIITNHSVEEAIRRRIREHNEREDAADALLTDRRCPHCGRPCPRYRKTCKHCHEFVGRER